MTFVFLYSQYIVYIFNVFQLYIHNTSAIYSKCFEYKINTDIQQFTILIFILCI